METTIQISKPDGTMTPPVTLAQMKEAVETVKSGRGRPKMKPDSDFDKATGLVLSIAADELRQFIERYEHLEAEKKDIADQQKEVMAEAKGLGYDTKVMRMVIALRKRDKDDIAEEEAALEIYKAAMGMS